LSDGSFCDWSDVLQIATDTIGSTDRDRLIGLPTLLLDVAIATEAEVAFVTALAAAAPTVLATAQTGDATTIGRFRDRLGFEIEDLDHRERDKSSIGALAELQRNLFNEHSKPSGAKPDDEIDVFSAPGEGRECVEIVRRVIALANDGVPFDRVAVLLRSPQDYRAHLGEAFARADVPVHLARGAVRPDPAGRAFVALLECAADRLSARKFAEYLSLAQVPDATPGGAAPEAMSREDLWVALDPESALTFASENGSGTAAW
jgi:ATP-dependent helicase/nuclease subunit B